MKAKSTRSTPASRTCMIRTCPTARNSRTRPEIRMKSQAQSSKPPTGRPRPAPTGFPWGSGASGRASVVADIASALQEELDDGRTHDPRDRDHGSDEQEGGRDAQEPDAARQCREE